MKKFFLPFIIILSFGFLSCTSLQTPVYSVDNVSGDKKSFIRIVQISDLHSNDYGENQEKLVQKILDAEPDLIFFTGDIFDFRMKGDKPVENVRALLRGVEGICPLFYVCGNHEFYEGHNNEFTYLIRDYGGTVLEDEAVTVNVKNHTLVIAGVSDPIIDVPKENRYKSAADDEKYLKRVLETSKKARNLLGDVYILLAHRPDYIKAYTEENLYNLIFSGHAHGGQWRFPPLINGLYAPGQGLFPKYAGGRYDFLLSSGKTETFIVSRGLCHQTPKFPRIFNDLEVVVVNFSIAD